MHRPAHASADAAAHASAYTSAHACASNCADAAAHASADASAHPPGYDAYGGSSGSSGWFSGSCAFRTFPNCTPLRKFHVSRELPLDGRELARLHRWEYVDGCSDLLLLRAAWR